MVHESGDGFFPSYWQETNEICDVLQMLPLCETSPFFSISQVSVSGFEAYGSHPLLSLETQLWPLLKHVICKRLCGTMHYLKGSLIASRITTLLTVSQADESRGLWTSVDSTILPAVQFPPCQCISQYCFLSIGHWRETNRFSSPGLPAGTDSCHLLQR